MVQSTEFSYELVVEALPEGGLEGHSSWVRLLAELLDCPHTEVTTRIQEFPFRLGSTSPLSALDELQRTIIAAGGKALLVRRPCSTLSRHEPSLKADVLAHWTAYRTRLDEVLRAVDTEQIARFIALLDRSRRTGKRIFVLGNGGSASTAAHFVNDLNKRLHHDGDIPMRAISLVDSVAWLTATANDEGYDRVFTNQLWHHLEPGDLVVAISSSGNSPNVVRAVEFANSAQAITIGIVGFGGGSLKGIALETLEIPTHPGEYEVMEDATLALCHLTAVHLRRAVAARNAATQ